MKSIRGSLTRFVLALLLGVVALTPARADEKKADLYVLSVGVEPKSTAQGRRDLYARDAEFIDQALSAAKPLYRSIQITVVNGQAATRDGVLQELGQLAKKVRP